MDFSLLKELCKVHPMLDIVEVPGPILGVPPQSGRLMSAARLYKSIDNELFLGLFSLFRRGGGHGVVGFSALLNERVNCREMQGLGPSLRKMTGLG